MSSQRGQRELAPPPKKPVGPALRVTTNGSTIHKMDDETGNGENGDEKDEIAVSMTLSHNDIEVDTFQGNDDDDSELDEGVITGVTNQSLDDSGFGDKALVEELTRERRDDFSVQGTAMIINRGSTQEFAAAAAAEEGAAEKGKQDVTSSVSADPVDVNAFIRSVPLLPFGVLGQQLNYDHVTVTQAPDPSELAGCVFVDPAGLHHIQPPGGPSGAHGAAGAIYKAIGIAKDDHFPADVVAAVTKTGDAKYHKYAKAEAVADNNDRGDEKGARSVLVDVHVIHAVGPDLRADFDAAKAPGVRCTRPQAVAALTDAYHNILLEFLESGQPTLRLLPVSGGIFAGEFKHDLPELTHDALEAGFARLAHQQRHTLSTARSLHMCVFAEDELSDFVAAGFEVDAQAFAAADEANKAAREAAEEAERQAEKTETPPAQAREEEEEEEEEEGIKLTVSYDYDAAEDWQLSVLEGESVRMVTDPGDGWAEVVNSKAKKGFVPRDFLVTSEEYAEDDDEEDDDEEDDDAIEIEEKEAAAKATAEEHADKEEGTKLTVSFDYDAAEDWQLSVLEGESVGMVTNPGDGWAEVVNSKAKKGFVPRDFLVTSEEYSAMAEDVDDEEEGEENSDKEVKDEEAAAKATAVGHDDKEAGTELTVSYDYDASDDWQLSVLEGESVRMVNDPGDGWAEVVNSKAKKGFVPRDFLVTSEEYSAMAEDGDDEEDDNGEKDGEELEAIVEVIESDEEEKSAAAVNAAKESEEREAAEAEAEAAATDKETEEKNAAEAAIKAEKEAEEKKAAEAAAAAVSAAQEAEEKEVAAAAAAAAAAKEAGEKKAAEAAIAKEAEKTEAAAAVAKEAEEKEAEAAAAVNAAKEAEDKEAAEAAVNAAEAAVNAAKEAEEKKVAAAAAAAAKEAEEKEVAEEAIKAEKEAEEKESAEAAAALVSAKEAEEKEAAEAAAAAKEAEEKEAAAAAIAAKEAEEKKAAAAAAAAKEVEEKEAAETVAVNAAKEAEAKKADAAAKEAEEKGAAEEVVAAAAKEAEEKGASAKEARSPVPVFHHQQRQQRDAAKKSGLLFGMDVGSYQTAAAAAKAAKAEEDARRKSTRASELKEEVENPSPNIVSSSSSSEGAAATTEAASALFPLSSLSPTAAGEEATARKAFAGLEEHAMVITPVLSQARVSSAAVAAAASPSSAADPGAASFTCSASAPRPPRALVASTAEPKSDDTARAAVPTAVGVRSLRRRIRGGGGSVAGTVGESNPPAATIANASDSAVQLSKTTGERKTSAPSASFDLRDSNLNGLGSVTLQSANRLMDYARAFMSTAATAAILRSRCAILVRQIHKGSSHEDSDSPPPPPPPSSSSSSSSSPPSSLLSFQPPYFTKPTLVTLHVQHGRLWCSDSVASASASSASPAPSPSRGAISRGTSTGGASREKKGDGGAPPKRPPTSTAFNQLCELRGAAIEATLVPNGPHKQRLVLTLTAASIIQPSATTTTQLDRGGRIKVVMFPKNKEHFVRIAGAVMFYTSR